MKTLDETRIFSYSHEAHLQKIWTTTFLIIASWKNKNMISDRNKEWLREALICFQLNPFKAKNLLSKLLLKLLLCIFLSLKLDNLILLKNIKHSKKTASIYYKRCILNIFARKIGIQKSSSSSHNFNVEGGNIRSYIHEVLVSTFSRSKNHEATFYKIILYDLVWS